MTDGTIDAWSITNGYHDTAGQWHPTSPDVRAALIEAMGGGEHDVAPAAPPMRFVAAGESVALDGPSDVTLEDGTALAGVTALPPDLPIGYHHLAPVDGRARTRLVVSPRRCPEAPRAWGWAVQLYALRSAASWGIGDLGDLAELARWSAGRGAGVVMTNPLHAGPPTPDQDPSPYYASSRAWRNPLYLRVEDLPGVEALGDDLPRLASAGRALTAEPLVDRAAVFRLKFEAFERVFAAFEAGAGSAERGGFEAYVADKGVALARFSTYCALAERHGAAYGAWPSELRHPDRDAVADVAASADIAARIRFHAWLQWRAAQQVERAAGAGVHLVGDLAVGFDPEGADAWVYQDLLARRCRVGAPPDAFNSDGQDWGLPPFIPWKLRAAGYEPIIATLRSCLAGGGGLRIDHVMGLFRLWWIPPGAGARDGGYVRYRADELLDVLAIEATRAGAFVVGEDLGTVEPEVREEMGARHLLGNRVLWFEPEAPRAFSESALASISTHDLPTVAGLWTGADVDEQRRVWGFASEDGAAEFRQRLMAATGIGPDAAVPEVIGAAHAALATAPSRVVLGQLDDACAALDRPNLPGTVDERPNWRIPLPLTLEQIQVDPLVDRVATALAQHR